MTGPASTTQRLSALRALLSKAERWGGSIQALIVPSEDAHQSEYVATAFERRAYISGFHGSAGIAVVGPTQAALWTDGRYFMQAEKELDTNWTLMKQGMPDTPSQEDWLNNILPANSRVGVNPYLVTYNRFKEIGKVLSRRGHTLVALPSDPIDEIWGSERPPLPNAPIVPLDMRFTGQSTDEKLGKLREAMAKADCRVLVLTALDEIAWTFNLRGSDVTFNPVFYAYAVVTPDDSTLFVDNSRLTDETRASLQGVNVASYDSVRTELVTIAKTLPRGRVWVGDNCSFGLLETIPEESLNIAVTPACKLKAVKNPVELAGARNAHIRDGAALCAFLAWLEIKGLREVPDLDECKAADVLEDFRRKQEHFVGLSFNTISGFGSNGAIIHYRSEPGTAARIGKDQLYLLDSGAQYLDGTTDVTRTVHLGTPTPYERRCYTLVLKGHVNLARTVFPPTTTGHQIDAQARVAMWRAGLDFRHGTGHGVGAYLNVHEGPHMITMRVGRGDYALEESMLVTNEPGYYEDGKFGIRLENVTAVVRANTEFCFGGKPYMTFDNLTMAPFDRKLIDVSMLLDEELQWVNDYHVEVRKNVAPVLHKQGLAWAAEWLEAATQPLEKPA